MTYVAEIKCLGQYLKVDIMEELEKYEWVNSEVRNGKLLAASPFREDNRPSFFVDLNTGGWADSGAVVSYYESGNLPKLISLLSGEPYEEVCNYLIERYGKVGINKKGEVRIKSNIRLRSRKERKVLDESLLTELRQVSEYLSEDRKISPRVQRYMDTGFSKKRNAISIPWRHLDGSLASIKYRGVDDKKFRYESGGHSVSELVYGIDKIYAHNFQEVVICEAEIDALSWMDRGIPSIALGGSSISDIQKELIVKSPIESLILAMDNDEPGDKLKETLINSFKGEIILKEVKIPLGYKDSNEAWVNGVDLGGLRYSILMTFSTGTSKKTQTSTIL